MSFSYSASWGGTSTGELAGLFFLCIWEEDFEDKAYADREEAEGGGERQPISVPSAGNQLGLQQAAPGNSTWFWLWFCFCCVRNCKAASSQSALERL